MKGNIYKIFNDVNDKVYIGKTLHSIAIAAYKNDQLIKTFKSHKAAGQWLYENGYTQSQNWDNISATLGRARKNPNRTAYGFKWKEIGE